MPLALLDPADQDVPIALRPREVVVGELPPLLLGLALELVPVALDLVPVDAPSSVPDSWLVRKRAVQGFDPRAPGLGGGQGKARARTSRRDPLPAGSRR